MRVRRTKTAAAARKRLARARVRGCSSKRVRARTRSVSDPSIRRPYQIEHLPRQQPVSCFHRREMRARARAVCMKACARSHAYTRARLHRLWLAACAFENTLTRTRPSFASSSSPSSSSSTDWCAHCAPKNVSRVRARALDLVPSARCTLQEQRLMVVVVVVVVVMRHTSLAKCCPYE